jgi:hypothetical protein
MTGPVMNPFEAMRYDFYQWVQRKSAGKPMLVCRTVKNQKRAECQAFFSRPVGRRIQCFCMECDA